MKNAAMDHKELIELLEAYCAAEATEDERQRLADLLRDDGEARSLYIQYMDLHAALAWESSAAAELDSPQRADGRPALFGQTPQPLVATPIERLSHWLVHHPGQASLGLAGAAIVVMLALLAFLPVPGLNSPFAEVHVPAADRIAVAKITGTEDCRWAEGSLPLGQGSNLYQGQYLDLKEGAAEITLDDGASFVLEGSAQLFIDSASRVTLRLGRIAAHVPPAAVGFVAQTPATEVVDLGTDFGIEVDPNGNEEIHVFTGEVNVNFHRQDRPSRRLKEGEALRLAASDGLAIPADVAADPASFRRAISAEGDTRLAPPLPPELHPPVTRGLTLWLAADGAIRLADDNHVAVWGDMPSGDNQRAANAWQRNRQHSPAWIDQAISGRPALQFDGDDFLMLASPENLGILMQDYEMLIVARSASPAVQFLVAGTIEEFEVHLNGDAGARFIPTGYAAGQGASDLAPSGTFTDASPHIFAVRTLPDERHHGVVEVDGRRSTKPTSIGARSANNTPWRIGMRYNGTMGFVGEIAEFLIYRGSLTTDERRSVGKYLAQKYSIPADF